MKFNESQKRLMKVLEEVCKHEHCKHILKIWNAINRSNMERDQQKQIDRVKSQGK